MMSKADSEQTLFFMQSLVKRLSLLATAGALIIGGCHRTAEIIPSSLTYGINTVDNVLFTNDGGALIAGYSGENYTFIKTNDNLDIEWSKNSYDWGKLIGENTWEGYNYSVKIVKAFETAQGTFICFGQVEEGGCCVSEHVLVVVLDGRGNQINKIVFEHSVAMDVLQTDDNGYLLLGYNNITKLDGHFTPLWSKTTIASNSSDEQTEVTPLTTGGFALTGSASRDQIVLKTFDNAGQGQLSRSYPHGAFTMEDVGFDLRQMPDLGFLIVGRAGTGAVHPQLGCQIIRTNAAGDTTSTRRFAYSNDSYLETIVSADPSELIVSGSIGYPAEPPEKSIILRLSPQGGLLDSISTAKFQKLLKSPQGYYLKITSKDATHVRFDKIQLADLFQ
jgi:hypothetical protein